MELSQTALAEMRSLLAELRPPAPLATSRELLETQGLVAALEAHLAVTSDAQVTVEIDAARYRRQGFVEEHALYRIAQEAISNARKHAQATLITLTLVTARTGKTTLQVTDDGAGFSRDLQSVVSPPGSGLGLGSMRERAEKLGAHFQIRSRPGEGTRVEVILNG